VVSGTLMRVCKGLGGFCDSKPISRPPPLRELPGLGRSPSGDNGEVPHTVTRRASKCSWGPGKLSASKAPTYAWTASFMLGQRGILRFALGDAAGKAGAFGDPETIFPSIDEDLSHTFIIPDSRGDRDSCCYSRSSTIVAPAPPSDCGAP